MEKIADQIKRELGKAGYDYMPSNQFSVEMANMSVIVSQKIDLSLFTQEKDKLSLLFFMERSSFKGPIRLTGLSANLSRYPKEIIQNSPGSPETLLERKYTGELGQIPTKEQLYREVVERLNNKNISLEALLKDSTLERLFKAELPQEYPRRHLSK